MKLVTLKKRRDFILSNKHGQKTHNKNFILQEHRNPNISDQGLMFGFACDETEAYNELKGRYFPLPAALSQRLSRRLKIVREEDILPWARPDGKTQVTVAYNEDGSVLGVDTVVLAIQHDKHLKDRFHGSIEEEQAYVRQSIVEHVIEKTIPQELLLPGY